MSTSTTIEPPEIEYPDSDGQPMAENTLQFEWIQVLQMNIDDLFKDVPDVFVAGDNLIYPVEGHPEIRNAPDVYVIFGRPKGHRGSYQLWQEEGLFPQVVFEILSPGNRRAEMSRKLTFYDTYGAEEYYLYDPARRTFEGYVRGPAGLQPVATRRSWTSPRLGIRFDMTGLDLVVYKPDGKPFQTFRELSTRLEHAEQLAAAERQRAEAESRRAEAESRRAEAESRRAEAERMEKERLLALLKAAGIESDAARS